VASLAACARQRRDTYGSGGSLIFGSVGVLVVPDELPEPVGKPPVGPERLGTVGTWTGGTVTLPTGFFAVAPPVWSTGRFTDGVESFPAPMLDPAPPGTETGSSEAATEGRPVAAELEDPPPVALPELVVRAGRRACRRLVLDFTWRERRRAAAEVGETRFAAPARPVWDEERAPLARGAAVPGITRV
jgi:hypothetical protein